MPIGLLALLAAFPLLRESRKPEAGTLDAGGVIFLICSLFLLVFPLVEGGNADARRATPGLAKQL
ncbi:hypothetical protein ccbrp13_25390 [Ktedonobacteria bacterium brp13]|nr:hypothetical protein ccbrp13_25390 [Ktedonobacteria bacterium brp13]